MPFNRPERYLHFQDSSETLSSLLNVIKISNKKWNREKVKVVVELAIEG